jgi:O-antigen/teichoic acid export membrane protein
MKDNMEEIDKLIKETLSKEEAKFYDNLDEQNVFQMFTGLFQGKNKWLIYVMNVMTIIFFVLFVYCLVMFFGTDQTNDLIKWGIGGIMFLMALCMLKLFAWLQMDKNALLRELKRLELQLLSVTERISE